MSIWGKTKIAPPEAKIVIRRDYTKLIKHSVLVFAVLLVIIPIFYILITSLKTQADYAANKAGLPTQIYLGNISTSLRSGRFFLWFANSIILAGGGLYCSLQWSLYWQLLLSPG